MFVLWHIEILNKKVYPIYYSYFLTFEKMKSQKKKYSTNNMSNMYGGSGKTQGRGGWKWKVCNSWKNAMATQIVSMK